MYPWILFINLFLRNAQRKYTSISESIDLYANLSQIGSELLIRYSKIVNVSSWIVLLPFARIWTNFYYPEVFYVKFRCDINVRLVYVLISTLNNDVLFVVHVCSGGNPLLRSPDLKFVCKLFQLSTSSPEHWANLNQIWQKVHVFLDKEN